MTRQIATNAEAASITDLAAMTWRVVARQRPMGFDSDWHYTIPVDDVKTFRQMVANGAATSVQRRTGDVIELLAKLSVPKVR
jgi:hypothetical protein